MLWECSWALIEAKMHCLVARIHESDSSTQQMLQQSHGQCSLCVQ